MSTTTPERINVPDTISDLVDAAPCEWVGCDREGVAVIRYTHRCCGCAASRTFCGDHLREIEKQVTSEIRTTSNCLRCGAVFSAARFRELVRIISVTPLRGDDA